MPRALPPRNPDLHDRRCEVEAFVASYRSQLLPGWLEHRLADAVEVVRAIDGIDVAETADVLSSLCGFMAWVGRDVPLRDSLTRVAIREWSLSVLAGVLKPGTHDHKLRRLYQALDVFDGLYMPRRQNRRLRKPWSSDDDIAVLIELAGDHPARRGMIAAAGGAGLIAGERPVELTRVGDAVFACQGDEVRRVLDEFAHLVDGQVSVTRSTTVNFGAAATSKHGMRQVSVRLRRAWRRRVLALPAPAVLVRAAYGFSDQAIEDVFDDLPHPPWSHTAALLRNAPTNGGV